MELYTSLQLDRVWGRVKGFEAGRGFDRIMGAGRRRAVLGVYSRVLTLNPKP